MNNRQEVKAKAIEFFTLNFQENDHIYGSVQPYGQGVGKTVAILFPKSRGVLDDITIRVGLALDRKIAANGVVVVGFGFNHLETIAEELSILTGKKINSSVLQLHYK